MVHDNAACRHAFTACLDRSSQWRGIGGSRRAQESRLPGSEDDHSGDRTDSNRVNESVRRNWKRDHEGRKIEQIPQGIQMHSRLVLSQ